MELRPVTVAQISDGQALIDSGLAAEREGRGRRPVPAAAGQPCSDRCTARPREEADLQSAAAEANPMNISAPFIPRPIATILLMVGLLLCGLAAYPLLPVQSLPNVNYPTISGHGAVAGRRSADHGVLGRDAARAAVRPDSRPHADDLVERARLHPGHGAVRSEPQRRQRRGRRSGGDQRRGSATAAEHALSADDPQGEPGRHADPGDWR